MDKVKINESDMKVNDLNTTLFFGKNNRIFKFTPIILVKKIKNILIETLNITQKKELKWTPFLNILIFLFNPI